VALPLSGPAQSNLPAPCELLGERTAPELAYPQARFAGLVSYGGTAKLLGELLPLGRRLHPDVVRRQTQGVVQQLGDELGEERSCFIDICQRDREELRLRPLRRPALAA
jgi:hypothetical protein